MADVQTALHAVPAPPADAAARLAAVDTGRSVLVQAPAGAGKTDLLTKRFLALLARVEEPEEVLAITFTRAATAEMRSRILEALDRAERGDSASSEAISALANAKARGWRLLEQPQRLDVQTIDSLCLRLAHAQPLLARLGGRMQAIEDAKALYAQAARRTLAQLGADSGTGGTLDDALHTLLLQRDNNLAEAERLLAGMLADRGAWLGVLPLAPETHVEWAQVRATLEEPFAREHARILSALAAAFARIPAQAEELLALARYAEANLAPAHTTAGYVPRALQQMPGARSGDRAAWLALADLLLTKGSEWRRSWDKSCGFPAKGAKDGASLREEWKQRMAACSRALAPVEPGSGLLALFCSLRSLPLAGYTEDQWVMLQAVFHILRRAAAELRVVFAEADRVDFTEIAMAAETVLSDEGTLRGVLESERTRHLLIDEFQDTSRAQYRLIAALLREWREGDGRTVFVVGDPLQSIYSFRQAEVALFHETRSRGLPCGEGRRHSCAPLTLTQNFRSHHALVDALNTRLARVFSDAADDVFVPAVAAAQHHATPSFNVHPHFLHAQDTRDPTREQEADDVVRVLRDELPHLAAAQASPTNEYRIAVLVRARNHLATILPALRAAKIPFRAVELEPLTEQPEVVDLLALVNALLHPADRLAWLSVLRAPWCGLLLGDLHTLAGGDDRSLQQRAIPDLFDERLPLLSADGQQRATRVWSALRAALATRYTPGNSASFAAWVERTWKSLGGDACLNATARDNAETFFTLLDQVALDGSDLLRPDFAERLARLCAAPDSEVSERFGVQLMTIHKAKGLGFDVVLLPGLDRTTHGQGTELLTMLQRVRRGSGPAAAHDPDAHDPEAHDPDPTDELLLAPLGKRDDPADPTCKWVSSQKQSREREESRRLFYVACTRARTRLHLFATIQVSDGAPAAPVKGTLLAAAWPGLEPDFRAALAAQQPEEPELHQLAASAAVEEPPAYMLERLPADWRPALVEQDVAWRPGRRRGAGTLFERTQSGSVTRRARGTAMHALLEQLAREPGRARAEALKYLATQSLRSSGLAYAAAAAASGELAAYALAAAADAHGAWVLAAHAEADVETAWQHLDAEGVLRTVRVDRSFLAGPVPGSFGETHRWIIDYKTGAEPGDFAKEDALSAWLEEQKTAWRRQLETYGAILREARNDGRPICYALFFPELRQLLHWSGDAPEE